MAKWIVLGIVVAGVILWLRRGKQKNLIENPDVKELDQKRFYVTPTRKDDSPPDDHESTHL